MKLYTSHWGNRDLGDLDAVLVGISRGTPRWLSGYKVFKPLWPSRKLFVGYKHEGTLTAEEYEDAYRTELEYTGVEKIASGLTRLYREGGEKPLVLLCWCKSGGLSPQVVRRVVGREDRPGGPGAKA